MLILVIAPRDRIKCAMCKVPEYTNGDSVKKCTKGSGEDSDGTTSKR